MNSTSIHNIKGTASNGVSYDNSNAITITFKQDNGFERGDFNITLFDLPKDQAHAIHRVFSNDNSASLEDEIRADERRKFAAKMAEAAT